SDATSSVVSPFINHSMVEHPAVNYFGVGSNHARGAEKQNRTIAICELTANAEHIMLGVSSFPRFSRDSCELRIRQQLSPSKPFQRRRPSGRASSRKTARTL